MTATMPRPATLRVPRYQAVRCVRMLRSLAGTVENRSWPQIRERRPEAFQASITATVDSLAPRHQAADAHMVLLSALAGHLDVTPTWPVVLAWASKQSNADVAVACLGAASTLASRIQAAADTAGGPR